MNSLLNDTGSVIDENFILPKSLHLCMIRYEDGTSIARGEEEQLDMVLGVKTIHGRAREEREVDASKEEEAFTTLPACPGQHCRTVSGGTAGLPRPALPGCLQRHCRPSKTGTAGVSPAALPAWQGRHCRPLSEPLG